MNAQAENVQVQIKNAPMSREHIAARVEVQENESVMMGHRVLVRIKVAPSGFFDQVAAES